MMKGLIELDIERELDKSIKCYHEKTENTQKVKLPATNMLQTHDAELRICNQHVDIKACILRHNPWMSASSHLCA